MEGQIKKQLPPRVNLEMRSTATGTGEGSDHLLDGFSGV